MNDKLKAPHNSREGSYFKRKIDAVALFLTFFSIGFLAFFIQSTLNLTSEMIISLLKVTAGVALLTQVHFQIQLSKWLKPLISFLDSPPSKEEFDANHEEYLTLATAAFRYPTRHIVLSLGSWLATGLLVTVICYFIETLNLFEAAIILNTVLFSSIIINMIAYHYDTGLVAAVMDKLSNLEGGQVTLPHGVNRSVSKLIVTFIVSIIAFLLLFFVQIMVLSSIENYRETLYRHGLEIVAKIREQLSLKQEETITDYEALLSQYRFSGYSEIFIVTSEGERIAGNVSQSTVKNLQVFQQEFTIQSPLLRPFYLFERLPGGQYVGLKGELHTSNLVLILISPFYASFIILLSFIGLYLSSKIAEDIARSLRDVCHSMHDISQGKSDLTKRIRAYRVSELIELSNAFNLFVSELGSTVRSIQDTSESLLTVMDSMYKKTQDFVRENRTHETYIHDVFQAARSFENHSKSVYETLKNVQNKSNETREIAHIGEESMVKVVDGITSITETAEINATVVEYLVRQSQSIQEIMKDIEHLADETRLLSFNAMLEAVGSAGQGTRFTVIADEVRKLADNVANASHRTKKLIEDILVTQQNLVKNYENEKQEIELLHGDIRTTHDEFLRIVHLAERMKEAVDSMNADIFDQGDIVEDATLKIGKMVKNTKDFQEMGAFFLNTVTDLAKITKKQYEASQLFKVDDTE